MIQLQEFFCICEDGLLWGQIASQIWQIQFTRSQLHFRAAWGVLLFGLAEWERRLGSASNRRALVGGRARCAPKTGWNIGSWQQLAQVRETVKTGWQLFTERSVCWENVALRKQLLESYLPGWGWKAVDEGHPQFLGYHGDRKRQLQMLRLNPPAASESGAQRRCRWSWEALWYLVDGQDLRAVFWLVLYYMQCIWGFVHSICIAIGRLTTGITEDWWALLTLSLHAAETTHMFLTLLQFKPFKATYEWRIPTKLYNMSGKQEKELRLNFYWPNFRYFVYPLLSHHLRYSYRLLENRPFRSKVIRFHMVPWKEDFTLPHRFQVDSTGLHMSIWKPPGVQMDLLWQRALPNFGQNSPGFQVGSKWTPNGPDGLHGLHSTSHQN